jgi:hypothetical protein
MSTSDIQSGKRELPPQTNDQRDPASRSNDQRDPASRSNDQRERLQTESGELAAPNAIDLIPRDQRDDLQLRWERVQVGFVDQPRDAVRQAHDLVDQLVKALTVSFTQQRDNLESTWSTGEDVSTEDLRLALQKYRALFNRLLST